MAEGEGEGKSICAASSVGGGICATCLYVVHCGLPAEPLCGGDAASDVRNVCGADTFYVDDGNVCGREGKKVSRLLFAPISLRADRRM